MSMAVARAKYTGDRMNYMGDPGLGSFFKGVAKVGLGLAGMVPGVGSIARTLSGAIFPPAPGTQTYAQIPRMGRIPPAPTAGPGGSPSQRFLGTRKEFDYLSLSAGQRAGCPPFQKVDPSTGTCAYFLGEGPGLDILSRVPEAAAGPVGFQATTAMLAGKPTGFPGYHWNKSGYFLMSGEYVSPGTKAVRNRRRNPANPRATSNAITRIKGAKRYAKSLSSISIRKKC